MPHDRELLEHLAAYAPIKFDGEVFRATRRGLDPLAASMSGGRWMQPNETPTLYTSRERNGALAEIVHHWSQLTPMPSKPVVVHTLGVRLRKTLRLGRAELIDLAVDWEQRHIGIGPHSSDRSGRCAFEVRRAHCAVGALVL